MPGEDVEASTSPIQITKLIITAYSKDSISLRAHTVLCSHKHNNFFSIHLNLCCSKALSSMERCMIVGLPGSASPTTRTWRKKERQFQTSIIYTSRWKLLCVFAQKTSKPSLDAKDINNNFFLNCSYYIFASIWTILPPTGSCFCESFTTFFNRVFVQNDKHGGLEPHFWPASALWSRRWIFPPFFGGLYKSFAQSWTIC